MSAMRTQVAGILANPSEDDMPLNDDDIRRLRHAVAEAPIGGTVIGGGKDAMLWTVLARIVNETAGTLPSRVPGSTYEDTVLGYAANADAYGVAIFKEVAALRTTVDTLVGLVAKGDDTSAEKIRAMLREELPKLDVVVNVADPRPALARGDTSSS
jgi:hypothetical protein